MDMKWLIASDIHGSALCCGELIKAFGREGADRLLLLGDLLYHGPRNDFPEEYDTRCWRNTAFWKRRGDWCSPPTATCTIRMTRPPCQAGTCCSTGTPMCRQRQGPPPAGGI